MLIHLLAAVGVEVGFAVGIQGRYAPGDQEAEDIRCFGCIVHQAIAVVAVVTMGGIFVSSLHGGSKVNQAE